jgi:hypothetical protein
VIAIIDYRVWLLQAWPSFVAAALFALAAMLLLWPHKIPAPKRLEFAESPTRIIDMANVTRVNCFFKSPKPTAEDVVSYTLEYSGVAVDGTAIPLTTAGPFKIGEKSGAILLAPGDQVTLAARLIDLDGMTSEPGPGLAFTAANTAPSTPAEPLELDSQADTVVSQ